MTKDNMDAIDVLRKGSFGVSRDTARTPSCVADSRLTYLFCEA